MSEIIIVSIGEKTDKITCLNQELVIVRESIFEKVIKISWWVVKASWWLEEIKLEAQHGTLCWNSEWKTDQNLTFWGEKSDQNVINWN